MLHNKNVLKSCRTKRIITIQIKKSIQLETIEQTEIDDKLNILEFERAIRRLDIQTTHDYSYKKQILFIY